MLPDADATAQARNSNTDLDGRASVAALPDTGHLALRAAMPLGVLRLNGGAK
jgi:hypothetical protein